MRFQNDRHPWNLRALLASSATPFASADYGPRAAICRQGDPCDSVTYIEKGRTWLSVTTRSGKEAICGRPGTGAFVGEEALVGRGAASGARTARTLADRDERRLGRFALPDLPQEIIAEMAGTTRSRVNAFMGKFKKCGFIEVHGGVLHVTPSRLLVVADGNRRRGDSAGVEVGGEALAPRRMMKRVLERCVSLPVALGAGRMWGVNFGEAALSRRLGVRCAQPLEPLNRYSARLRKT